MSAFAGPVRILLAAVALCAPGSALACSCLMFDSFEDAQERAAVAVKARMLSVRIEIIPADQGPPAKVEYVKWRVISARRGPLQEGQVFETRTYQYPPSCGMGFIPYRSPGQRSRRFKNTWWLFNQWPVEVNEPWSVATCSRSQPVE